MEKQEKEEEENAFDSTLIYFGQLLQDISVVSITLDVLFNTAESLGSLTKYDIVRNYFVPGYLTVVCVDMPGPLTPN